MPHLTRREVLGTTVAGLIGPRWAAARGAGQPAATEGAPDDEAYWAGVRARFELEPDRHNFVTVVRGVTTRVIREQVAADAARYNAFRSGGEPAAAARARVRSQVAAFIGGSCPATWCNWRP